MPEHETVSINIETNLKRKLEEYNFFHRDNKINLSALCRDALKKELDKRSQPARTKEMTQLPDKKEKETTCLHCGAAFAAKRTTKKFCSNKCKTAYYRKRDSVN